MNKLIVTSLGAAVLTLSLAASRAQTPAGPTGLANAAPAALCGPGYTPQQISYHGGVVKSYACVKTIPDKRPCNKNMNKFDGNPVYGANSLKLSYTCSLPEQ